MAGRTTRTPKRSSGRSRTPTRGWSAGTSRSKASSPPSSTRPAAVVFGRAARERPSSVQRSAQSFALCPTAIMSRAITRPNTRPRSQRASPQGGTVINHHVLFRFNDDISPENADAVVDGLRRLGDEIPEGKNVRVERNIGRPTNFDVLLMVEFEDQASYERYGPHPYHQQLISEVLTPNVKEIGAIQF